MIPVFFPCGNCGHARYDHQRQSSEPLDSSTRWLHCSHDDGCEQWVDEDGSDWEPNLQPEILHDDNGTPYPELIQLTHQLAGPEGASETVWVKRTEIAAVRDELIKLYEALMFYANPGTYFAFGFYYDPPTGGFDEDFDEDHGDPFFNRPMPGKFAREATNWDYEVHGG